MQDRIIKLLKDLVSINSIFPNERDLGEYIYNYFKDDFKVEKQIVEDGRFNVIVEKGEGNNVIGFYSHLDTVGIVEGWNQNPLELKIEEDKAYGLGSFDMKGGMVANILNFLDFDVSNKDLKLKLFFCCDEENISKGGHALAGSKYTEDVVCMFSPEPAFKHGINGIATGRIGRAVFKLKLKQESRHFMFYSPSNDLSIVLSKVLLEMQNLYIEKDGEKEFLFMRDINLKRQGLSVPEELEFELESSILPGKTIADIQMRLQIIINKILENYNGIICEINLKERETPYLESYRIEDSNKFLGALEKSIKEIIGKDVVKYFRSSVADDNIFASKGITVLSLGPEGANAHAPNEWISLLSIEELVNIYKAFLENI